MKTLAGLTLQEIEEITDKLHASKFRARQIHNWIYLKSASHIDEMTDLSAKFREELKQIACVSNVKIARKQESADGTIKYLARRTDRMWPALRSGVRLPPFFGEAARLPSARTGRRMP